MKYNIFRVMSNFSDLPRLGGERPIMRVEEDLRSIIRNLNTLITDIQTIKSDMTEIKRCVKACEAAEREKDISKGWWYN
tara:strand:+ start:391 stop:627 length:237 start_codon:yes stop_codon:yes gene_type:complete